MTWSLCWASWIHDWAIFGDPSVDDLGMWPLEYEGWTVLNFWYLNATGSVSFDPNPKVWHPHRTGWMNRDLSRWFSMPLPGQITKRKNGIPRFSDTACLRWLIAAVSNFLSAKASSVAIQPRMQDMRNRDLPTDNYRYVIWWMHIYNSIHI